MEDQGLITTVVKDQALQELEEAESSIETKIDTKKKKQLSWLRNRLNKTKQKVSCDSSE